MIGEELREGGRDTQLAKFAMQDNRVASPSLRGCLPPFSSGGDPSKGVRSSVRGGGVEEGMVRD